MAIGNGPSVQGPIDVSPGDSRYRRVGLLDAELSLMRGDSAAALSILNTLEDQDSPDVLYMMAMAYRDLETKRWLRDGPLFFCGWILKTRLPGCSARNRFFSAPADSQRNDGKRPTGIWIAAERTKKISSTSGLQFIQARPASGQTGPGCLDRLYQSDPENGFP